MTTRVLNLDNWVQLPALLLWSQSSSCQCCCFYYSILSSVCYDHRRWIWFSKIAPGFSTL